MDSILEQSIIATLGYFNIFEYPLTLLELKTNLLQLNKNFSVSNVNLTELEQALNNELLKKFIEQKNGFYFLSGNDKHYQTRQQRYYIADQKIKRALKIAWLFKFIPTIQMIAVSNSLGYSNTTISSDIDLFIVTKQNRVWTTKLLTTLLIISLSLRPTAKCSKDKICLSFFVDENNLNLEKFQLSNTVTEKTDLPNDIYLTYWTTQLLPIFDRNNTYDQFWQDNSWVNQYLPNRQQYNPTLSRKLLAEPTNSTIFNRFGDYFETLAKKIQLKRLNPKLKALMNKDSRVIINDNILKLYSLDRREQYQHQWLDFLSKIC